MAPLSTSDIQTEEAPRLLPVEVAEDQKKALLGQKLKKTSMCSFFQKGHCKFGSRCDFAHLEQELQQGPDLRRTRLCQAFKMGHCSAQDCKFAHSLDELRPNGFSFKTALCVWHAKGKCGNGHNCRFAHGHAELRCAGDLRPPEEPPRPVSARCPPRRASAARPSTTGLRSAAPLFTPAAWSPMKVSPLAAFPAAEAAPVPAPLHGEALAESIASIAGKLRLLETRIEMFATAGTPGARSSCGASGAAGSTSAGSSDAGTEDASTPPCSPASLHLCGFGPPGLELRAA